MNEDIIMQRLEALEQRVAELEAMCKVTNGTSLPEMESDMLERYGKYVNKTKAARILGVTRSTVYAMLADGRIKSACNATRVDVCSIAAYMAREKKEVRKRNA